MITIDRERLISEKQNYKASAEGERLPKEAMLLIFSKYLFQYYSVVGKLAHFTIIYALFLTLTETVFEYALCRQCGCRVYLE